MNNLRKNERREKIQFNPLKDHKNNTKRERKKNLGNCICQENNFSWKA